MEVRKTCMEPSDSCCQECARRGDEILELQERVADHAVSSAKATTRCIALENEVAILRRVHAAFMALKRIERDYNPEWGLEEALSDVSPAHMAWADKMGKALDELMAVLDELGNFDRAVAEGDGSSALDECPI